MRATKRINRVSRLAARRITRRCANSRATMGQTMRIKSPPSPPPPSRPVALHVRALRSAEREYNSRHRVFPYGLGTERRTTVVVARNYTRRSMTSPRSWISVNGDRDTGVAVKVSRFPSRTRDQPRKKPGGEGRAGDSLIKKIARETPASESERYTSREDGNEGD